MPLFTSTPSCEVEGYDMVVAKCSMHIWRPQPRPQSPLTLVECWDQKCNSMKPKSLTLLFHGLSNHMDRDSKDDVMGNQTKVSNLNIFIFFKCFLRRHFMSFKVYYPNLIETFSFNSSFTIYIPSFILHVIISTIYDILLSY